ncbi:distal long tail fiber assembly catalyst [Klebsiella phage CPRSA]|nr:distal long tail fiber assembly catalyst [Klebsiella phage CPRSA]
MAVTGPWVGSSAKAETGEAWMVQAGAKLREEDTVLDV